MAQGILGIGHRLVFGSVILEEFIGGSLNGFPLLFAGLLFEDLAVTLLQSLSLTTLFGDGLRLVGRAGGTAVSAPVQPELVMIKFAVFEYAHLLVQGWR